MVLRKKKTTGSASKTIDAGSTLPVKQLHPDEIFKALLDQKFNEFGLALREELDRQVMAGNSDLRDAFFRERNERKRSQRVIFGFLGLVVVLLGINLVLLFTTTESSVQTAVSKEFADFQQKNKVSTESLINPIRQSVEKNLNQVTSELNLNRAYVDIYALEGLSRNGSRKAFEELGRIAAGGGVRGTFAEQKLKDLRSAYSILNGPLQKNIALGEIIVSKNAQPVGIQTLSPLELIYVLNSSGASTAQVHQILTMLWNQPLTQDHERELWAILQNSQNLPACVATCALLQKNFGNRGSIYDFMKWKGFLENRM